MHQADRPTMHGKGPVATLGTVKNQLNLSRLGRRGEIYRMQPLQIMSIVNARHSHPVPGVLQA
jgi:hypothetical protein